MKRRSTGVCDLPTKTPKTTTRSSSRSPAMATAKKHIQRIRKNTFSIGGPTNPLAPMLDKAVMYLSTELYQKDVHFLMELIQNAEDNEYFEEVDPSLEFVITSSDITKTGAPATLLIFNNEKGFSAKNIESICNVGNSTKKGQRKQGYIGEKGIGFKSVFLVTSQPYIFSNGYQIRFNEKPCPHCNLGYVVPEWVEDSPSLSDIRQIYGSASSLPTTTLVLPLKPDKVKPVMDQLSGIHPEVLLFLSKIKRLSVRKNDADPQLNTVSAVAISKEINFVTRKNIDAESYTLHLSAEETSGDAEKECSYYLWKQKFPVRKENLTERRKEVEEWVITLAFPFGNRLSRGMNSPGVYAFLPTEMVTNFPFIIQADFVLASSRETILLDEKWNQGILDCVPIAFVNALTSLVKSTEDAPLSSSIDMFRFLPVNAAPYPKFNVVRDSIKAKLAEENIVPSESDTKQKFFHRPCEVGRLKSAFWKVLTKAKDQGVSLNNLSSHGCYVLSSFFDKKKYKDILKFLGVGNVNDEWYAKCIQGSSLVTEVSEETYLELLIFLAEKWSSMFNKTKMSSIPLLRYVSVHGRVSLCSVNESAGQLKLCASRESDTVSWLIDWNREFRCVENHFFLPKSTQDAVRLCPKKELLSKWLADQGKVTSFNANEYAIAVCNHLSGDWKLVIAYTHFLYRSSCRGYVSETDVQKLCGSMPLVDNYGTVTETWYGILAPATGSKWVELIGSNPWSTENYVELNVVYSRSYSVAGETTTGKQIISFLESHLGAADVPHIAPPNARIPSVSSPLTKENAFLLLDWIHSLRDKRINIPEKFLTCIKEGGWLRVKMNGVAGWKPPSQSFLLTGARDGSNWLNILQHGSVFVDVPLVDESFYGDRINEYKDELKAIGVMFDQGEVCKLIGKHLMSLAASSTLTQRNVISMLTFMKLLREKFLPLDDFVHSVKGGKWLKTCCGNRSPSEAVLYDAKWKTASLISNIPFLDQGYYGCEILSFKKELQLLGVQVGCCVNYKLVVVDYLKSSSCLAQLTAEALLLLLDCMNSGFGSEKIIQSLKCTSCLKTDVGYKAPGECFLSDPEWGTLLDIFGGFPLVDNRFYGCGILKHKQLLKQLGVKVDFDDAISVFIELFVQKAKSSSMTKENVLSFLSCYRQLKSSFKERILTSIQEAKWLRTRLGDYRSPKDCILFSHSWDSIAPITLLPFIDDSEKYYGKRIHEFREELKSMGVVVEFQSGVNFVPSCIRFPQNLCNVTSANVLSLLECIKIILSQKKDYSFLDSFPPEEVASRAWLKTHSGYCTPASCCLFDSTWASHVKHTDGPFIDEEFYGSTITSYEDELKKVGVTVDDSTKACSLLASHLHSHADTSTIVRIYSFLKEYNWKPEKGEARWIWIPLGSESGEWVNSVECVLHDKDGLFGLQLKVLEKYYQRDLLMFFACALDVKSSPSLDDYLNLWKVWESESSGKKLSQAECSAFWGCVMRHRFARTEKRLADDLKKLPVVSASGEILLADKSDVFIADDLQLKDLFEKASPQPVFVWYPQPSSASLPRTKLMDLFRKIGARTISESVQKEETSLSFTQPAQLKQVDRKESMIGKGLVRLILSFLAGPALNMEAKERHEAVQTLLNLTALETVEPITVSYSLSLSSGVTVSAASTRMIRWDRESSKLFMQKMGSNGGKRSRIEYATHFSDVIAEGVLWKNEDQIEALSEMIKVGFLLDFDDEEIQLFIKTKKLQIFMEDEDFLCGAFASE